MNENYLRGNANTNTYLGFFFFVVVFKMFVNALFPVIQLEFCFMKENKENKENKEEKIPFFKGIGKGQGPCHLVNNQGYDPENCMCRFTVSLRDSKFLV